MGYLDVEVEPYSLEELALCIALCAMDEYLRGLLET